MWSDLGRVKRGRPSSVSHMLLPLVPSAPKLQHHNHPVQKQSSLDQTHSHHSKKWSLDFQYTESSTCFLGFFLQRVSSDLVRLSAQRSDRCLAEAEATTGAGNHWGRLLLFINTDSRGSWWLPASEMGDDDLEAQLVLRTTGSDHTGAPQAQEALGLWHEH